MDKKWDAFLEITKKLNQAGITPLLMGSLGLEYVTQKSWQARDIDIHVSGDVRGWEAPDESRIAQWPLILAVMEDLGYQLIDLHEHEFVKANHSVEFGVLDTLPEFAGIKLADFKRVSRNGIQFLVPTAQQFLQIYLSSAEDSYRAENNNHKDKEKIDYLKQFLEEEDGK